MSFTPQAPAAATPPRIVNWLHVSDWHQHGDEFGRRVIRDALLNDIRGRTSLLAELSEIHLVFFTGDLANMGRAVEYDAASTFFLKPVLEAVGVGVDELVLVPGNHDLDRGRFHLLPPAAQQPFPDEATAEKWLRDDDMRERLLDPFRDFRDFSRRFTGRSGDYGQARRLELGGVTVGVVAVNSAIMSGRNRLPGGDIYDYGFLVVGEPQIYEPLEEIRDCDLKIAALHHPFAWLQEFDRHRVEDILHRRCDFILQGHQHRASVQVTSGTSGQSAVIPAAASYDRRDRPNGYNLVHLDLDARTATVFLRRWNDDRGAWQADTNTYPPDGRFEFLF